MTRKTKQPNWYIPIHDLIVIGGRGVGKTALIIQFTQLVFVEDFDPTFDEVNRKQCVIDDKAALLDIKEVMTYEGYAAWRETIIRHGEGFLFVYSTTSRNSFDEISDFHQEVLRLKGDVPIHAVLVATKSDLQQEREVSTQEGRELAERLHCQLIETSSKEKINVDESFYTLTREIRSSMEAQSPSQSSSPADKSGVCGCRCLIL
ncbi:Ras GTPase [Mortierella sp. AD094]|nr:Ras GTPase [Mortierella sp. AD094]